MVRSLSDRKEEDIELTHLIDIGLWQSMLNSLSAELGADIRVVSKDREVILQSRPAGLCREAMKRKAKHPACFECCAIEDLASCEDGGFALCAYCDSAINYVFNLRVDSIQGHVIIGPVWIAEKGKRPAVSRLARKFGIGQTKFAQLSSKLTAYSLEEFRKAGEMVHSAMLVIAQTIGTNLDLVKEVGELRSALLSERRRTWQQMVKDGLTGTYRYNYGLARLKEEVARVEVYGGRNKRGEASPHSLSVAVIGIKQFHAYIDRHGPEAGRSFLSNVGSILQKRCRCTDLSARLSDEEFFLILPSTNEQGVRTVLTRIRDEVQKLAISDEDEDSSDFPVLAEGAATYPDDGEKGRELLRKALERVRA